MAFGSKRFNSRLRKVLVGEYVHLRRNWERLIFVGQVTGVRQTSEDILSRQTRVVRKNVILRLSRRQEFQNEFDGETRATDHRLACQDLRVYNDLFRQRHTKSIVARSGSADRVSRFVLATGHPSTEQLSAEQGTGPITDVRLLRGDFWPEEESIEEFLATLHEWRGHARTDPAA